jgi:uncharacterized membrane protein YiaA
MNTLSWFLYFADVIEGLNYFFGIVALLSVFIFVGVVIWCIASFYDYRRWRGTKYEHVYTPTIQRQVFLLSLTVLLVSVTCSSILPSKNTMYAIAVSEMGEKALASEVGKKAQRALEVWITQQIGEKK